MLITEMTLHSANTGEKNTLVTIEIVNDGTGTTRSGNYNYKIKGRLGQLLKEGRIINWPRQAKTACALLQRVINDAYPRGRF